MVTKDELERYSSLQAKALLILVLMILHQLYWAASASQWANPLVYIVIGVEVICGGLVAGIGAARASDRRWLYRMCAIASAVPWWLGILYIIYGVTSLAAIPYGIYVVRDSLSKLVGALSFWWLLISSLAAGVFWTAVGNSLRKGVNGLTQQPRAQLSSQTNGFFVKGPLIAASGEERIVSRQDTDTVFGLNKADWNAAAEQMIHPEGLTVRLIRLETGTGVGSFDPKTGMGVTVQPLYTNTKGPPDMLIVGSYFPVGTFQQFSDQGKKNIEAAARSDLGDGYVSRIQFNTVESPAPGFDLAEITITQVDLKQKVE
jgi:hypothetical protein